MKRPFRLMVIGALAILLEVLLITLGAHHTIPAGIVDAISLLVGNATVLAVALSWKERNA